MEIEHVQTVLFQRIIPLAIGLLMISLMGFTLLGGAGEGSGLLADVMEQATDIIGPSGSMTVLFRTPDQAFSGFRYLLAQGVNQGSQNAFAVLFDSINTELRLRIGNLNQTLLAGAVRY